MKTYPLRSDSSGVQSGFEIENIYIGINKIVKLLSAVDGVSNIKKRRLFDLGNQYHIEFDYFGDKFVVWEPYGDNSRYWIGPKEEAIEKAISPIETVFKQYNPPFIIRLLGDLVSLNLKNFLKR